jgi:Tol biopolymer transport system component/DNA-binding winged helix-turn-helix (wHTH) protein
MSRYLQSSYTFGPFRLDSASGVLFRGDQAVPLSVKAAETLRVLVENGGRTVRREDLMAQVWPETFVEEANLTVTISMLRKALGDTPENPQYVETVPKRGYRFVAAVGGGEGAAVPVRARRRLSNYWVIAACVVIFFATVFVVLARFRSSSPAPRILRTAQITHSGRVDTGPNFTTDGARLYFTERQGGHWSAYQVPVAGGEAAAIPTPFGDTVICDLASNHSDLLVGTGWSDPESPLWIVPLVSGSPHQVNGVVMRDAAWSPDGHSILFTRESDLYIANRYGTSQRKVASAPGALRRPRMSPNGRVIRFTLEDGNSHANSLWEVAVDGTGLRRLIPPMNPGSLWEEGEADGSWTPDGKFFLFRAVSRSAGGDYRTTLWALREGERPVQFYASPLHLFGPIVSPDARKLYVVGKQQRFELARYSAEAGQFVPYLAGLSASWVGFSRDGQWITYVSQPDRTLWRSKADGSQRVQLTFAPLLPFYPRWSPDGTQIAFMGVMPGGSSAIYVVPRDGGASQALVSDKCDNPNWSPDGKSLLFSCNSTGKPSGLYLYDVADERIAPLTGTEGFTAPNWSPDGKYLAAVNRDYRMTILDYQSRRTRELSPGVPSSPCKMAWSRDSLSVYVQDCFGGAAQPVYRVWIGNSKVERLTPAEPVLPGNVVVFGFSGLTPDGSILGTLVRNNSDLYALDVDFEGVASRP